MPPKTGETERVDVNMTPNRRKFQPPRVLADDRRYGKTAGSGSLSPRLSAAWVETNCTRLYIEGRFPMFGVRYIAINDNVGAENSERNDLMPFKNLFNVAIPAGRHGWCSGPRRSGVSGGERERSAAAARETTGDWKWMRKWRK